MTRKKRDKGALLRLAEAITDGVPVPWEDAQDACGRANDPAQNLRVIESVARAYRGESPCNGKTREVAPGNGGAKAERSGARILREQTTVSGSTAGVTGSVEGAPDATSAPFDSNRVWGPLVILEKIGEGGFAEVYRAFDPTLECEVALKLRRHGTVQDERTVQRFLDEARGLARVKHPNVIVVHGADVHDGRIGLWTDLVRGQTLAQCVAERGPYSAKEASLIGIELCCAVAGLHAAGLLHRDIKPSNVMREEGGKIILMDFGSAGEISSAPALGVLRGISGTPLTTAPEVFCGEAPGPAADIYGLGVLLYWLVSGRYPVEGNSLAELRARHESRKSTPLLDVRPNLPTGFAQVVERALHPDARERYETPGEMQRALALALGAMPASEEKPVRSARRRTFGIVAASVVLAAALVVAGLVLLLQPLRVQAILYRDQGGAQQPIGDGQRVRPDDQLFLEIEPSKAIYVYAVSEDEQGKVTRLLPVNLGSVARLAGHRKHRLPSESQGVEQRWTVTTQGGRETILVVGSRTRLGEVEKILGAIPENPQGGESTGDDLDRQFGTDRGVVPRPRRPLETGPSDAIARISGWLDRYGRRKDVWTWRIQLANDGT